MLETGKLRWTSCCRPELNLRASLLFLGQNQFCFIYFLGIWSQFMKSNADSKAKDLKMSGKELEKEKGNLQDYYLGPRSHDLTIFLDSGRSTLGQSIQANL